jgi:hypothetical protein
MMKNSILISIGLTSIHLYLSNAAQSHIRSAPFARDAVSLMHATAALDASIPLLDRLLHPRGDRLLWTNSAIVAALRGLQPGLRLLLCLDVARRLTVPLPDDGVRLLPLVHAEHAFSFVLAVALALAFVDWMQCYVAWSLRAGGAVVWHEFAHGRRVLFALESSVRLASLIASVTTLCVFLSLYDSLQSPLVCVLTALGFVVSEFFVEDAHGHMPLLLVEAFAGATWIDIYLHLRSNAQHESS